MRQPEKDEFYPVGFSVFHLLKFGWKQLGYFHHRKKEKTTDNSQLVHSFLGGEVILLGCKNSYIRYYLHFAFCSVTNSASLDSTFSYPTNCSQTLSANESSHETS